MSNNIIDSTSNKRAAFLWGLHMTKITEIWYQYLPDTLKRTSEDEECQY